MENIKIVKSLSHLVVLSASFEAFKLNSSEIAPEILIIAIARREKDELLRKYDFVPGIDKTLEELGQSVYAGSPYISHYDIVDISDRLIADFSELIQTPAFKSQSFIDEELLFNFLNTKYSLFKLNRNQPSHSTTASPGRLKKTLTQEEVDQLIGSSESGASSGKFAKGIIKTGVPDDLRLDSELVFPNSRSHKQTERIISTFFEDSAMPPMSPISKKNAYIRVLNIIARSNVLT